MSPSRLQDSIGTHVSLGDGRSVSIAGFPSGTFVLDRAGSLLHVDEVGFALLELGRIDTPPSAEFADFLVPADRPHARELLASAAATGFSARTLAFRGADGRACPVQVLALRATVSGETPGTSLLVVCTAAPRAERDTALVAGAERGEAAVSDGVGRSDDSAKREGAVPLAGSTSHAGTYDAVETVANSGLAPRSEDARRHSAAEADVAVLAHAVAHDLRSPLGGLHGFAQILRDDRETKLGPVGERSLRHILTAAARVHAMIDAIDAYARLVRDPARSERVEAQQVVEMVVASRAASPGGRVQVASGIPALRADRARLATCIGALLENAFVYARAGAEPAVRISGRREGRRAVIRVEDDGIGIDARQHERIFALFQRLHAADERPGIGAGLALARRAAHSMHGSLRVESAPGTGSTFFLELPVWDDDAPHST